MFPVLFTIGSLTISSFGFFLVLAILLGVFLVWRLARAWDIGEERILDLTLLTFLGGLIGGRLYFIATNLSFFSDGFLKMIWIPKYPGFSFWGAFLGGWLTLYFLARRFKLDFWHIADFASIGFLGGLILADIGCFFGGCGIGSPSKMFFAVPMLGAVGKRFPVQILEGLLLFFVLLNLWSRAIHFHPRGRIISLALIYLGVVKFFTNFFRPENFSEFVFSVTLVILGLTIFYQTVNSTSKIKRTPLTDLKAAFLFIFSLLTKTESRKFLLSTLAKNWYNKKTSFRWKIANLGKLLRRMRVKSTR